MIYEYALDPEFLIDIADKSELCMHLKHYFGYGNTCVIAGYPLNILKEANKIIDTKITLAHSDKQKASLQEKKKRLNDIWDSLSANCTKRLNIPKGNNGLLSESNRLPFYSIITNNSIYSNLFPISIEHIRKATCSIYNHKRTLLVQRSSKKMLDAIRPLLRNASQFTFIDPYFYPENKRFRSTYNLFFSEIASSNHVRVSGLRDIIIICAKGDELDNSKRPFITHREFKDSCKNAFSENLLQDLRLTIYRIKSKTQELHNRYILTDIGGILLGHGTDCSLSHPESFDDIALLEREHWAELNRQYTPKSLCFDWSEEPIVI